MSTKPELKIGHLRITDHLVLGMTAAKIAKETEKFQYSDLKMIPMTGWNDIGDSLTEGSIDIAFILAPYAMELFHSGQKLKLVLFAHRDGSVVIGNKKAGVTKLEDFKGKTVLIPYHQSIHHMIIDQLLTEKGMKTGIGNDVNFEVVAPAQIPEMIEWDENGEIGGYIVAEPFGSLVVKAGNGVELKCSKDVWPNHPCCVVVVRDEIAGKYPDAVKELTESLVKSGKLIEEKPDVAAKVGAAFLKQEEDIIASVLTQPKGKVTYAKMLPVLDDLEKMQNYLTTKISAMSGKINLEKFVDLSYAKASGAV
jgi:NitT/TauT family transport system substrate-binding protein